MLKFAIPKGRMHEQIQQLLSDAGIRLQVGARAYRPSISLQNTEVKILKPQNVVEMLHFSVRDIGFAGADWVTELDAEIVELLDTGLDPVRIVVAAPSELIQNGRLAKPGFVVASEYERLTKDWIRRNDYDATYVRSFGATEVFPPEDADCIVDNTATGSTLRANALEIVETVMSSSTRLYANPRALDDPQKREQMEQLVLLLRSVLDARKRVVLELNAAKECIEPISKILPCMREPTISPLHGTNAFAIRAAVPRSSLPDLIPKIKSLGGTDIIVSQLSQIVS